MINKEIMGTVERFMQYVSPEPISGCWLWTGALKDGGYGAFNVNKRAVRAHRWLYEVTRGAVPHGLDLDHLCRVRCCVNPDHLQPVTRRENTLRGIGPAATNSAKTHCLRGHPLSGSNLYLRKDRDARNCLTCRKENWAAYYLKRRGAA